MTISDIEARLIGEYLETRPLAVPGARSTHELLAQFEAGHAQPDLPGSPVLAHDPYAQPCPFLGGHGNCTIHPVRPIMCALHHSLAPDASLCELQPGRTQPVPYANATVLKAAMLLAQPGARWADIRAFFASPPECPSRNRPTPAPPPP